MSITKTIIPIGGGEISLKETIAIDRHIVGLAKKQVPRALFMPTASGEPSGYIDSFFQVYGQELGCEVTVLKILTENPSDEEIQELIFSADIIYVGGGNTQKMMDAWRKRKIDNYLREAHGRGIILTGLSAGSICWFESGHSDSFREETGQYGVVRGLGLLAGLHCPHYNERPEFDQFMKDQSGPGIAIEDNCAIIFQDDTYQIIKSQESVNAFIFHNQAGKIIKRVIPTGASQTIASLYEMSSN